MPNGPEKNMRLLSSVKNFQSRTLGASIEISLVLVLRHTQIIPDYGLIYIMVGDRGSSWDWGLSKGPVFGVEWESGRN